MLVQVLFQRSSRDSADAMNIHQAVTSSDNHQSSGQAETGIKFVKCIVKKYFDTHNNKYLVFLQVGLMSIGPGLLSLAVLLFSMPVTGLMPKISRSPILFDHDDSLYATLIKKSNKNAEKK